LRFEGWTRLIRIPVSRLFHVGKLAVLLCLCGVGRSVGQASPATALVCVFSGASFGFRWRRQEAGCTAAVMPQLPGKHPLLLLTHGEDSDKGRREMGPERCCRRRTGCETRLGWRSCCGEAWADSGQMPEVA